MRTYQMTQLRDILQSSWSVILKNVKVIKERLRNHYWLKETKDMTTKHYARS